MQIKQLSGKIKERLELRLKINAEDLKVITKEVEKVQQKVNTVIKNQNIKLDTSGVAPNIDKITQKYTQLVGQSQKLTQETTEYVNKLGQSVKIIDDIDKETQNVFKSTQIISENYKAQRIETEKLAEAMAKGREQSSIKSKSLDRQQELIQAKAINKALEEQYKLSQQLATFQQKMLGFGGLKGELDIFGEKFKGKYDESALAKLRKDIESLTPSTANLNKKMKESSMAFSLLKQEAAESGNVLTRIFENAYKFLRFYLVGGLLVRFVGGLKDSIATVKELDTSLTELNKVADLTSVQLKNITDRAYEAGSAIGRTGKEVIDATTTFKRAGYEIEQAFELSQQALLLTNIGDGINDVTEASSSLIAVLKGFKKEAGETSHIVDALNEVSNNFAIDTVNLTEIMKRVSGTIAQTGTSYEELLGLATGGFESLRNAEMVASGLNMITQRLKGMSESGESVEGLIPKIQKAFDKYTKGAVSIIDKQNGGLHSTFEILQQLSKVYPTLSDEARAYLNEAIAGNRQNKVLVAIMENWKNVEAATQSATDSLGSATKENEKYLNSIEGRVSLFNSAVQKMWKNTINSEAIKFVVDLGTAIVKLADNDLARLILKVGALTAAVALLNKGIALLASTSMAQWIVQVYKLNAALGITKTTLGLIQSLLASPLFKFAIVIAGVYAFAEAIDFLTVSFEEQQEKVDDITSKLASLNAEYEQLKSKENKTAVEGKHLHFLRKEIETQEKLLKIETERLMLREYFDTPETYSNFSPGALSNINKINAYIISLEKLRKEYQEVTDKGEADKLQEKILNIEESLNESAQSLLNYKSELGKLPPELEELITKIEKLLLVEDKSQDATEKQIQQNNQQALSISELSKEYELLEKAEKELNDTNYISEETIRQLAEQYLNFEDATKLSKDAIVDFVNTHKKAIETQIKNEITSTKNLIEQVKKRIEIYRTELYAISDVEMARVLSYQLSTEKSKLTELELQINKLSGLLGTIGFEKTKTTGGSPYSSKLILSYRDIQIAIENVSFELDKLKEKEKSLSGTDLINNLQQQNDLITQRIKLLEELNWRYGEDLPRLKIQLLELGFEYENIESQADKYNALSDAQKEKVDILVKSIDDLTDSYMKNTLEILQNKNNLTDLSATIEKVTEETQKYARELGEYLINKEIESLKQLKEQVRDTYQSKIDRIQREIDRLEERNDLLEEEETRQQKLLDISKQREKLENIKEQRNVRMFMDGQWTWVANPRQIREETTRLQDMQEEYFQWEEDLRRKNEIQKLKDQISALQTELKNEEQKYDTQIKNLQLFISEYKDRQSEFYGEQVKGLNNLMESLKDIEARSYEKRIEQLGDFVDKYNKLLNSISGMSVKPTTTTSKSTSSLGETWYIPGLGNVSTPSNPANLPEGAIRVKHKGGFAGESSSRLPDLVNKMFNVSPNEVLVKALKNELFIPKQNIFKNFMPNMQNLISTIQPNVAGATPSNNYVVHIDKVVTEDAASFVNLLPTLAHQYKGKK